MTRQAKMPLYKEFNNLPNAFGPQTNNANQIWQSYLDQSRPLTLELGCGKAEMSIALAKQHSDHNYIGVDLKADRLAKAARRSSELHLQNVAFIQDNILNLEMYFEPQSIDEIWITFPDPYPKDRQIKHRMLNRNFLEIYKRLLKANAAIHFKTDNDQLFTWSTALLTEQKDIDIVLVEKDLHASNLPQETKTITTFEQRFIDKNQPIKYLLFGFIE